MIQENRATQYCIVYLDISCFKVINELFNMETGDMILKTAAAYFKTVVGNRGLAARLSADHFAICMPENALDMELVIQGLDAVMRSLAVYRSIMFYDHYSLGMTAIFMVAVIFNIMYKDKGKKFLAICMALLLYFGIFTYALNGFMYLNGKIFIPMIPIAVELIAVFFEEINVDVFVIPDD